MERYPRQLHDMEKAEYLDAKCRVRENQLRLQQTLEPLLARTDDVDRDRDSQETQSRG